MNRKWRLPATFENVASARHDISAVAAQAGAFTDDIALVELAAGELIANAMEHGNGDFVDIAVDVRSDAAVLIVTNQGPAFRPPSVDLPAMELEENGRGLAILAAFGCTVTIERPDDTACRVTAKIPFQRDRYTERSTTT